MTFVAEYESANWFTEDLVTASVTCAVGDTLVASAVCGNQLRTLGISGGGLTWTQRGVISATSRCSLSQWTAVVGPGQGGTFNVTATFSGDGAGGLSVQRHSGIASIGAAPFGDAAGPAAPALAITTTQAGSTVVVAAGDHATVDGATRAWRTADAGAVVETTYWRSNFENAAYVAYHPDAGAAGAKTVGLTAPNTTRYSIAAVELVPAAANNVTGVALVALGGLAATATGRRTVIGSAAAALTGLTAAASGQRAVAGTGTAALGGLAATVTGQRLVLGIAAAVLGALATTSTGVRQVRGQAVAAFGGMAAAVAGRRGVLGTAHVVLGALVVQVLITDEHDATVTMTLARQGAAPITLGARRWSATLERQR